MELLTAKEVKTILKCSLSHVYKLAEQERIPPVRWSCPGSGEKERNTLRFKKEDVLNFIETHYQKLSPHVTG